MKGKQWLRRPAVSEGGRFGGGPGGPAMMRGYRSPTSKPPGALENSTTVSPNRWDGSLNNQAHIHLI